MSLLVLFAATGIAIAGAGWLVHSGYWRKFLLTPLRVNPQEMTCAHRGLDVRDTDTRDRIDGILQTFVEAFNVMITAPRDGDWQAYCDSRPPLLRAFAEEGIALGYRLRRIGSFSPTEFEREIVLPRRSFLYLHYVGLGFWSGMRGHSPRQLLKITEQLDPLMRYLCFDGFGFQRTFFATGAAVPPLDTLRQFPGYAANAAFQGVGRALWFRHVNDQPGLISALRATGPFAGDAAAGAGLAATFVHPDRLEIPTKLGQSLPEKWRPHFHLGMAFACKARDLNDPEWFSAELGRAPRAQREAIRAAIFACDRIEQSVRRTRPAEPYARWRAEMTQWLSDHVTFPLAAMSMQVVDGGPGTFENPTKLTI